MSDPITRSGSNYSAPRDSNRVPLLMAASSADGITPVILEADPSTHALVTSGGGGGGGGAATIADGADVAEGATTDAAVTAGNAGSVSGKLRQISADISSVKTNTAAATPAGTNIIGKVTTDQTTHGTTDLVSADAKTATGSTVPSTAFYQGGIASTSLPAAATNGNLTGIMTDKFGRSVSIAQGTRDIILPMTQLTLTATTTETSLITAVASTFLDLLSLVVINTSATGTQVDFRDSTAGTVRLSLYVPAGDTRGIVFNVPMPQAAVNTAWTAKCGTSVSSVIITGSYITNK